MDPDETFRRFVNAVCGDDMHGACDALQDLSEWLDQGGFSARFPNAFVPRKFVQNMKDCLEGAGWQR